MKTRSYWITMVSKSSENILREKKKDVQGHTENKTMQKLRQRLNRCVYKQREIRDYWQPAEPRREAWESFFTVAKKGPILLNLNFGDLKFCLKQPYIKQFVWQPKEINTLSGVFFLSSVQYYFLFWFLEFLSLCLWYWSVLAYYLKFPLKPLTY